MYPSSLLPSIFRRLWWMLLTLAFHLPASGQEGREYPLGPIGGYFSVSANSSLAVVRSVDAGGTGANAGLQAGDFIYGAFGQVFTPTGADHYGVTQELGFAVDRAEAGNGTLPLMVIRPGTGVLTLNVALSPAGAFGPAYPRNSAKYAPMYETAVADLHTRTMNSNGDMGYLTGFTGLCLLGHPNWNDTTGAKPYRLSINKIRDFAKTQIANWGYAPTENKLIDGSAIPNYIDGPSNWELGQLMMFLSEYYVKTNDTAVSATLQRGAEMCANTVQWWKQPSEAGVGFQPEYDRVAGMSSHGGVTGDYMHQGWYCGINAAGVHNMNGMAFARSAGVNMDVRPKDGHYFGFNVNPGDPIPAGIANALPSSITLPQYAADPVRGLVIQNTSSPLNRSDASDPFFYNPSLAQKYLMQMNFICRRSMSNGNVRYAPECSDDADGVRTAGALLGMSMYQKDVGGLDSADLVRMESMKQRVSANYMGQQNSHVYCFMAGQTFQAFCAPLLSDRQQRFSLDNWRFYYALSRTANNGIRYLPGRNGDDAGVYLNNNHCASINIALPYGIANGGYSLIPAYNTNRSIANFKSPFLMWPSLAARATTITSSSQAFQVDVCDGNGNVLAPANYTATWSHVSGPATATFSPSNTANTTISFPSVSATPYRVRLTIARAGVPDLVEDIDVTRANPPGAPVAPSIAAQPRSRTASPGGNASFTVTMAGTGPFVYQWRLNGVALWPASTSPTLSLPNVGSGAAGTYDCVITTPNGTMISAGGILTVAATPNLTQGGLRREIWNNISGGSVANLTSLTNYPRFPDATSSVTSLEAPQSYGDDYGQRLTGWLVPPTTGQYKFFLTADDSAELWLSTDSTSGNKVKIAQLSSYTGYRSYSSGGKSALINLTAGQRYYVEVLHKEAGGGDHLSVAWQTPGGSAPANGSAPIGGAYLESTQDVPDPQYNGLVSWWKFDEGSGSIAYDAMGKSADGATNAPVWGAGRRLGGLVFDGNDSVNCGNNASLSGSTPFTLTAWVKVNAGTATDGAIAVQRGPGGGWNGAYIFKVNTTGKLSFWLYGDGNEQFNLTGTTSINDGVWHHVAASRDANGNASVYLDGVLNASVAGTIVRSLTSSAPLGLGIDLRDNAKFFRGSLDDIRLFNRALSTAEIADTRNRAPEFANDPIAANATKDVPFNSTLIASDADLGETLTYSKVSGSAWLTVAANGALSGTPTSANLGLNQFVVRVTDSIGRTDDAALNVTVANTTNNAPTFTVNPFSKPNATEDSAYSNTIAGSATDVDAGDTLTYSKVSGPAWLSVAGNGALAGTPSSGDAGVNSFTVKVTDAAGANATATLNITVNSGNHAPIFTANPINKPNATEDAAYAGNTLAGSATDTDAGDTLTYSKLSGPAWLGVAANGALSGTPGNSDAGANSFTVNVTDTAGASAIAALNITVINVNDTPVFTANPINGAGATTDVTYAGTLAGTATDVDAGDTLTYAKVSGPAWLNVAANGTLNGTPGTGDAGANSFTVRAADAGGLSTQATLNISVTANYGNGTWTNAAGGSWPVGSNWNGGTIASGTDKTADFSTLNLTADRTVTLDGTRTIGNLAFGDTTPSNNWTLIGGTGGVLTLDVASGTPAITVNNQTTTIGLVLAGTEGLNKTGSGTLVLTGNNTYTGVTNVSAGTLSIGAKTLASGSGVNIASGATLVTTGQLAFNANSSGVFAAVTGAGTLALRSTTSSATSPDINFNANDSTNSTANWGTSISSAVDLGSAQRYVWGRTNHNSVSQYLASAGADANFTGAISGSGGLTFIAQHAYTGTNPMEVPFVLSGSNTFTGMLEIQRGSVYLNHANALAQGNALLLDPAAGNNARLFLYGNNATVSNLTSSGAGSASIANGNLPSGAATALATGTLTVNETSATTYAGTLVDHIAEYNWTGSKTQGPLALVKTGPATLSLTGANTYTGATSINGGTLLVNGSLANSATTVAAAGTLGGSGTIAGAVSNNGTIAPGNASVGTLTVNNTVILANSSVVGWEISDWIGAAGTGWDVLAATSLNITATSANPIVIRLTDVAIANFTETNTSFVIARTTSGITGFSADKFTVDTSGLTVPQGTWAVDQSGSNLVLVYTRANTAPVFTADPIAASATEDIGFSGTVTATDPDIAETLTYSKVSGPAWLSVASNGTLSGTPGNNDVGPNNFTVLVTDSMGAQDTAALQITVANVNDAPVFTADPFTAPATEDSAFTGSITATDIDAGDTRTYSKVSGPAWLTIDSNGTLSGTPTNANVGTNNFVVRVTDAGGLADDAALVITVANTNDAPVFTANPINLAGTEDTATTGNITATDIDAGETLTFTKVSGPAWLAVAANGNLSGTPSNANVGGNSFTVRVTDGAGAFDEAVINITVANVNDAPTFAALANANANEDTAFTTSVAGAVNDVDAGDTLTFSKVSGPAWLNVASNGTVSGTPTQNEVGSHSLVIRVTDSASATANSTLTVVVAATNDAPTFTSDPIAGTGATEGSAYSGGIAGSATDADSSDTLTYSKVSGPSWLSVAGNGALSGTPMLGTAGGNSFTVRVTDAAGASDDAMLTIQVTKPAGSGDADGDGFTNALEEAQGTDPYSSNSKPDPIYAGLQSWWKLDETNGTVAADATGRSQDGVLTGSPAWVSGLSGNAVTLNGTSQSIQVPTLSLNSNTVTISTWVKRNGAQATWAGLVFDRGNSASGLGFGASNQLRYHWNNAGSTYNFSSGLTVPDNTWTFCAVVVEPTKATLYMQPAGGVMQSAINNVSHATHLFSANTYLGQDSQGGRFFKGDLDSTQVYSRVLSAAEIGQLANQYALPLPWANATIGTGALAGSSQYSNGKYTVSGSGVLGGTADQAHTVYQTLSGDGEIVAKIGSLQNTGTGASVGVVVRDSLAAGAPHVFVGSDGAGTYKWSRRTTTGGTATVTTGSAGTPGSQWVRIVRNGDTFTVSTSTDGTTWSVLGSANVTMAANCYIGLAVSSGSNTTLNTSQFSSISVTP